MKEGSEMDEGFIGFLYRHTLEGVFKSKEKMAEKLDAHYRTLQHVFKKLDHQKGASLITVHLFLWLLQQEISVDCLYRQYKQDLEKKGIRMEMALKRILPKILLFRRKRI